MSSQILIALRDYLKADVPLADFFQTHYQKAPKQFIGYKRSPSANDYPSICYVPIRSVKGIDSGSTVSVSIVVGVNEPGVNNDVFDGVTVLDSIESLIISALENLKIAADISVIPPFSVSNDLNFRHPFHEREISFDLFVAASNADAVLNASRSLL